MALFIANSGSKTSSTLSLPKLANHILNGSALEDGIDSINLNIPLVSKVSVKIYHSGTDNIFCEIPQDSLSGILRPGDNLDITLTSKIMDSNRLDVVVYYGEHKIAEEEKLMHKGVKKI